MLPLLIRWLEYRADAMRKEQRAAEAGEFAHRHPDLARKAAEQVMPATKLQR